MKIKYCHSQKIPNQNNKKQMIMKTKPKELDILFKQLKSIKLLYVEIMKKRERKMGSSLRRGEK